jgi:hypothetical protein
MLDISDGHAMQARQFIRHPVDIPIKVSRFESGGSEQDMRIHSIGIGGVAFRCNGKVEPGTIVHLRIPLLEPEFVAPARVVWCAGIANAAEVGVEFLSTDDAFKARMVEQVCHIESYKQQILQSEGRKLSSEEAAAEWVSKFAANFPDPGSEPVS